MSSLRWQILELSGFGVHDEARFVFPQELAVLVAPNESGKSTAVAGLTAVVFGLPTSSDPAGWGQAKYRSYSSNNRFSGRVEFRGLDGRRYEVRRDFEAHEAVVRCLEPGEEAVLFSGSHNPGARKRDGRYDELLSQLVGIGSAELFKQTFSIEQPLSSGEKLSREVAQLLAGSGGGSHDVALERLGQEIIMRTKYTKPIGLPGRNKNDDRALERTEARIRELRQMMADGKAVADGLQRLSIELVETEEKLQARRDECDELGASASAAQEWLAVEEKYRREQHTLGALEYKLEQAREFAAEARKLQQPAEPETGVVAYDWSFVEGSARAFLEARREDAAELLDEYERFGSTRSEARAAREELEQYSSLSSLPEQRLAEIANGQALESQLEAQLDDATRQLTDFEAQAAASSPDAGFEDVTGLDEVELERLRRRKGGRARAALVGGASGAVVGVLFGWLLLGEIAIIVFVAAAMAMAGAGFGALVAARANRAGEARRLLTRHAAWRQRVEDAPAPIDLSRYRDRLQAVDQELHEFRERVAPYRLEYELPEEAVREYRRLRLESEELQRKLERYASEYWSASSPGDVDELDPLGVSGCWQRASKFLSGLGYPVASVQALARQAHRIGETEGWQLLAQDAEAWDRRVHAKQQREQQLAQLEARLEGILGAEGVDSIEALQLNVSRQRTEALATRNAFEKVCEQNPALPRFDDPDDRRSEVAQELRRCNAELETARNQMTSLESRARELLRQRAQLEGENPVNIAALEVELAALEEQRCELEEEIAAFALAYRILGKAVLDYQDAYLERLSELVSGYFGAFTGRRLRRVRFREDFEVRVVEEQGVELEPSRLSQGAQDQLALAARLAVADMMSEDLRLPLVFDDPFQNCDSRRLLRIREALQDVARERQVILLSHESRFLEWGEPVAAAVATERVAT